MRNFPYVVLALISTAVIVTACVTVQESRFTYRAPTDTLDVPLRLDGYYCKIDTSRTPIADGTRIYCFILWPDGTVAEVMGIGEVVGRAEGIQYGTLAEAHRAFQEKVGALKSTEEWGERSMGPGPRWGGFRVDGDSISIQLFTDRVSGWPGSRYVPMQLDGVIRNDTTFALTSFLSVAGGRERSPYDSVRVYHFHPFDQTEKPSSDNWSHRYSDRP